MTMTPPYRLKFLHVSETSLQNNIQDDRERKNCFFCHIRVYQIYLEKKICLKSDYNSYSTEVLWDTFFLQTKENYDYYS
jgi:trehalose-6-phosphate synthase